MRIVILGSPGSGKKTQASLLAEKYQLTILTVSDLVTHAQAEQSERGEQLRLMLQRGQSPAEEVILELLQDRISQPDMRDGFILDGFPRNLLQALTLDEVLAELNLPLDFVLLFEIETDALMERLVGRRTCRSCGAVYNIYTHPTAVEDVCDLCGGRLHQRADDTEETVSSRLHVFDHLTGPLLTHYGKQEKVLRVDGEGHRDQVFERTCRTVDGFLADRLASEGAAKPEVSETPGTYVKRGVAPEAEDATDQQPASSEDEVPAPKSASGTGKKPAKQPVAKKAAVKKTAPKKTAPKKPGAKKPASKKSAPKKAAGTKPKATTKTKGTASQAKVAKKAAKKRPAGSKTVKKAAASPSKAAAKGVKKPTTKKKVTKKTAKKAGTANAAKRVAGKKKAAAVKKSSRKQVSAQKTAKKKVAKKKVISKTAVRAAASKKKSPAASKKKVVKQSPVKKASTKRPATKKKVGKKKETKKAPVKRIGTKKTASKKTPAKKKPASRPANRKLAKKTADKPTGKKKIAKKTASKKKAAKKGAKSATPRR